MVVVQIEHDMQEWQLKISYIKNGTQCNCLSSGSGCENRGALRTTRARQCCIHWSLAKSLLAMLFSSEFQLSRRLLINAIDIVLAVDIDV